VLTLVVFGDYDSYPKKLIRGIDICVNSSKSTRITETYARTITGTIWVIWPVISKTMTETEMVCVTAPERAAAPAVA